MNAERLLRHYEKIVDVPDAMARLRRFILDLAVRGKLVPQCPNEEPASQLLKRISEEKARLVKAGEISQDKPLPPLTEADTIFDLPRGWEWVRLGHLAKMVTSGSRDWAKHYANEGAIFVRMGNLSKDHYRLRLDHIQHVKPPADGEGSRTRLAAGDILISITGEVGMLGLIPDGFGEAYINQHTAMVRPAAEMTGRYLPELFRSPFAQAQFNEPQRGIKNSFRLTDITQFVVPLPPIAEQHRIAAKVDELMALCDRLEAARQAREATRDRLAAASLARLNAPDSQTFRDDNRFALNALPALSTRPDQIKALRQTILNLAVRGKLVAQDPADEPAAQILDKLLLERRGKWESESKKGAKGYAAPDHEVGQFEIPSSWTWASALELCDRIESGNTPPATEMFEGKGEVPYIKVYNLTFTGKLDFSVKPTFVGRATHQGKLARSRIVPGDVLMNIVGPPLGKVSIVPSTYPEWNTNQAVVLFRPLRALLPEYLSICLQSRAVLKWIIELAQQTVGQVNISVGKCRRLPIPFPSVAEQHRIVSKVSELMALCNKLEASLATGNETRRRLLDALLAEALAPAQERDLEAAE